MMFPPGYRDLKSYRVFKQLSGLAYPIEAIFTLHNEIQISGVYTITVKDDEDFLYLLGITEKGITGEQIRNALIRSEMLETTGDPHVYYAKEFVELNKGLRTARENGQKGGRKTGTDRSYSESNESINRLTEELTDEPINRQKNERSNELTKEGRNELTKELKNERIDEQTNEGMNGTVTSRIPTGNPRDTDWDESEPF